MESIGREFFPYILFIAITSISIELLISKKEGLKNYNKEESLISAAIFFLGAILNGGFRALSGGVLLFAYENRLFDIQLSGAAQFGIAFFLTEFCYYWMHRYSHEVRLGWASHIVHHSPECFNFSIAYRLGLTGFFSLLWAFYIPIAWLGFDPKIIALCLSLNLLYQFWLHTELIPKLGLFEWLFNTPSHHRVHHASNPLYLDRNYGGTLIIYDRLFGTFQEEDSRIPIEYGLTERIRSKKILKISFMGWTALWSDMKAEPKLFKKIALILHPPGWSPDGGRTSRVIRDKWIMDHRSKFDHY